MLMSAGCGGTSQSASMTPPPPAPSPFPAAVISFCGVSGSGCTSGGAFRLATLRDLQITVQWQNLVAGTHTQTLDVLLPNGTLYQTFQHSFEIAEGAPGSITVSDTLPVAGSFITQRSLTGAWQVEVALDGQVFTSQTIQLDQ